MNLKRNIIISLMSVIALILFFIESPIPFFPPFLKMDISDLPAIITGIAFGPVAGVLVELFKNILHLFRTSTGGVGEIGNFVVGATYVVVFTLIYNRLKSLKGVIVGGIAATLSMGLLGCIVNNFLLIPFFSKVVPIDAIISMGAKINPAIQSIWDLVLYAVLPFNLIKGVMLTLLVMLLYKKVVPAVRELAK